MLNLRGWLGGLGGAAAVTIGVVAAALIVAGLTSLPGVQEHVRLPATRRHVALGGQSGITTAASSTSPARRSRPTSTAAGGGTHADRRTLAGGTGPMSVRHGETRTPRPRVPGSNDGSRDSSSPAPGVSAPAPGGGGSPGGDGGNPGGGGGEGGGRRQPASLGDAVKNTTQQLGDTVNGATQTVGDTVGAVSPVLGGTVKQAGPALGDTVKGTGDLVGNTVNGLLGGHH